MGDAAKLLYAATAAIALLGCETAEPQPPDPNTPLEPVVCDERAPLSLLRTSPDSALGRPPWLELCNVCPAAFELTVADVDLYTTWAEGGSCVVALPRDPWPPGDLYSATAVIEYGDRVATFEFEHPGTGERGEDPDDLGSATYRLELEDGTLRLPSLDAGDVGVLVRFEETADHGFAVHFGRTEGASNQQDECAPTTTLSTAARLDRRQLAAPLVEGDALALPFATPLKGGALQATLSSTGSALQTMALLVELDGRLQADGAEAFCADYEALAQRPLCGPCGDPAGEPDADTCITFVWEWSTSIRVPDPLVLVDVPGPDCADPS